MPSSRYSTLTTLPYSRTRDMSEPAAYGSNASTCTFGVGSIDSTFSRSASTPSPENAETIYASGINASTRSRAASSIRSALLNATIVGIVSTPSMSESTSLTASICENGSGCDPSTTCTIKSASATSSNVDLNASISCVGRRRTKPTVSTYAYSRPSLAFARRTAVSKVANSAFSTSSAEPVSRLVNDDLPAFV